MGEQPTYPSMQRMLNQLNRPFANVGRWMDINAVSMMLLVAVFSQLPRLAASDPDGYAILPLVLGLIALGFLMIIAEAYIAIAVFSGIGWMMNVPGFFAIGVVRGMEGAERRYRAIHTQFYRRLQGHVHFSGLVLIANLYFLLQLYLEWTLADGVSFPDIGVIMLLFISLTSGHLLIHAVAKKKQEKWEKMSDAQIHNDVELKRQKFPQLGSIPSVDEMEETLRKAKLGDTDSQIDAKIIDRVAGHEFLKNLVWMIIFFFCILLIFM